MLGVRKLKLCLDKKTITYSESNKNLETMHVFGDNFQTIEILGSSGKVFKALLRREYNFLWKSVKNEIRSCLRRKAVFEREHEFEENL